jgi:hypothetical protein
MGDDVVERFHRDGFVILRGVFSGTECERFVSRMDAYQAGRLKIPGLPDRKPDDFSRTWNQHWQDPEALRVLLDPRLREPLSRCMGDEPEGVQTMYFWKGSEQRRHQDQFYLPGCMSAWCPFVDVGSRNGTIWVQVGSHRSRLITSEDMVSEKGEKLPLFGAHYDDAVDALFARNGMPEVPVEASAGDVVLFHGVLIHRGGPIGEPGSYRHVLARLLPSRNVTGR